MTKKKEISDEVSEEIKPQEPAVEAELVDEEEQKEDLTTLSTVANSGLPSGDNAL